MFWKRPLVSMVTSKWTQFEAQVTAGFKVVLQAPLVALIIINCETKQIIINTSIVIIYEIK